MEVAYRGATLLDGTGTPVRAGVTILVADGTIRRVAPDAEFSAAELSDAEVVELGGRHVIPGLVDAHQHIATPPDRPLAEATLRRDFFGGVTATRDMADDLRQVADIARAALVGELAAPDIHYAALMAGPTFFDDPRTWQVSQGATPGEVPWMQAITAETDLPLAVAMARGTYATAVKIYADLPGELVAAITAEAHRQGLAVWAHAAVFPATPGQVVAAGVDSVSHAHLLVHEAADRPLTTYQEKPPVDHARFAAGDDAQLGALFAEMRRRGTVLDATASLWATIGRAAEDPETRTRALANDGLSAALTGQALRAGVTVCAGTDRDPDPADPWPPLFDELDYLVERCGLTPAEALRCASHGGALSLGAADRLGTVEPGKQADFVVLDEDPAASLAALRSVVHVVKRGRRHDRAEFDAERAADAAGTAGTSDTDRTATEDGAEQA